MLEYRRNTGWGAWPETDVKDPGSAYERIADYPIFIADRCQIGEWKMTDSLSVNDADDIIWLRMKAVELNGDQFNCLVDYVRPPFVRLSRESETNAQKN